MELFYEYKNIIVLLLILYLHYGCSDNYSDFIAKLGILTTIFNNIDRTCFYIVGTFNCSINSSDTFAFSRYIHLRDTIFYRVIALTIYVDTQLHV